MKEGGVGGARTNETGLAFEKKTDLKSALSKQAGYSVQGRDVFFNGGKIAELYKGHDLYKFFLLPHGVVWSRILSKRLLPDEAIFVLRTNTLIILEKKFQKCSGSTDEKLQTCDFKVKQYRKLTKKMNIKVVYGYILNDWYKAKEYRDVLRYIKSVGCFAYFNQLPFSVLGLPAPVDN